MLPENWSDEFTYSPTSIHLGFAAHVLFSEEELAKESACIEEKRVHPHIKIRLLDAGHPIAGQRGVFALKKIDAWAQLGEYVGEVFIGAGVPEMFPRKDVHCWFAERNGISVQVSSNRFANELAFINDYRGIADAPNVGLQWIIHKGFYHFGYVTLREIQQGEELLVDYGQKWASIYSNMN